jgi:signal peptidase I
MTKNLILTFVILLSSCNEKDLTINNSNTMVMSKCWTEKEIFVRGNSMLGILNNKEKLTLKDGYYNCNSVKFKDIVVFKYNNKKNFIKQIYGVPNDLLEYDKNGFILINSKKIKNISGEFYKVDEVGKSYIRLVHQRIKNKVIPKGHYFVLGTAKIAGYDSRRAGLVKLSNIFGKI